MFEFSTCQSLVCGAGVSAQLPEIAGKLGIKKILVVTDPGLIETGLVERVTAALAGGSVQHNLFSAVVPDPPESLVREAAQIAKRAYKNGTTLKEEVIKSGLIKEKDYDKIMNPISMTKPK